MFAFRCKNKLNDEAECGHLVTADAAAECKLPHKCPACGGGVRFTEQGIKVLQPEMWEVLAEATIERLSELGLKAEHVVRHSPWTAAESTKRNAEHVERSVAEGVNTLEQVV